MKLHSDDNWSIFFLTLQSFSQIRKIPEGGAEPLALLGLVRLIEWLASSTTLPASEPCCLVVDSGTGATAVGALHRRDLFTAAPVCGISEVVWVVCLEYVLRRLCRT